MPLTRAVWVLALGVGLVAWAALKTPVSAHQQGDSETESAGTDQTSAQRGEYLVRHVAMCIQCHTPRDESGALDNLRRFTGAPIPVRPTNDEWEWAVRAPHIAGLPGGWSREQLTEFLQTGLTPTGHRPRAPMPPFRMNRRDAVDIAAYVASLE